LVKARKRARSLWISYSIYIRRKGAMRQLTFYEEATSLASTSATWSGFSTMGR
jgi:hypothetical protein